VVQMVDHIRVQIMNRMDIRRQMAEKWVSVLRPEPQKFLNKDMLDSFLII